MPDTTLTHISGRAPHSEGSAPEQVWALVIAWCPSEPQRLGEVFLLPDKGGAYVIGRGPSQLDDPGLRVYPARQRPGRLDATEPLAARHLSRVQLRVEVGSDDLTVENVGRAPLLHGEQETSRARVIAGDTLQVGSQLLLLCLRRPNRLAGAPVSDACHAFGEVDPDGMVGESAAIWQLRQNIAAVGPREGHVLIMGASGTGKELVAGAVHARSPRARRPVVSRNAATIPEGLADAELFGNAKNFPNPGMLERPGLVGQADQSTLFLDEFAELPLAMQAHLLRVLDSGEYHRLGEATARRADLRLVAATNRPESALKHDIVARLTFRIDMPDLNARREDIPLLVRHQMRRLAHKDADVAREFFGASPASEPTLPCSLLRALLAHSYATNVRELSNLLWGVLIKHIAGTARLGDESRFDFRRVAVSAAPTQSDSGPRAEPVRDVSLSHEPKAASSHAPQVVPGEEEEGAGAFTSQELQDCLDRNNGVVSTAARELGLSSRFALHRLIRKHGLEIRKRSPR